MNKTKLWQLTLPHTHTQQPETQLLCVSLFLSLEAPLLPFKPEDQSADSSHLC